MSAIVPEPPDRSKIEYQIVGSRRVFGHEPGSKFHGPIPEQQEALLIESGHIKVLEEKVKPPQTSSAPAVRTTSSRTDPSPS